MEFKDKGRRATSVPCERSSEQGASSEPLHWCPGPGARRAPRVPLGVARGVEHAAPEAVAGPTRGHSLSRGSAGPAGIRARAAPTPGLGGSSVPPPGRPVLSGDSWVWMPPPRPPVLCAVSSFTGRGARLRRALRAGGRGGIGVLGWVQMVGVCEEASRARPRLRTWRRPCRAAGPWAGPATPRARAARTGERSVPQTVDTIKHLLCARRLDTARGRAAFLAPGPGLAQLSRHPGTPWRCSPGSPKLQIPQLPTPKGDFSVCHTLSPGSSPAGVPSVLGPRDGTTEQTAPRTPRVS